MKRIISFILTFTMVLSAIPALGMASGAAKGASETALPFIDIANTSPSPDMGGESPSPSPTDAPTPTASVPTPTANVPTPTADAPTPTADAPTPTADVPTPTANVPTPTANVPTPTANVPTPSANVPTPTPVAGELVSGIFRYKIEGGFATIIGCDPAASGDVTVPFMLGISLVTKIGDSAFSKCTGITSISLPEMITEIGDSAFFGCTNLRSISLPSTLKNIGSYAFQLCRSLQQISLPMLVSVIREYTFTGCASLTTVTIPANITTIGTKAFDNCASLTQVKFDSTIGTISDNAFSGCPMLNAAYFYGMPPRSFGSGVFQGAAASFSIYYLKENASYWAPNGETKYSSDNYPMSEYSLDMSGTYDNMTYVVQADNTVMITGADKDKISGTVVIPEKIGGRYVTAIYQFAFQGCIKIDSVIIPQTITSVGDFAFYGCSALTSAYFRGAPPTTFGSGVFDDTASTFTIYYRSENASTWAPNGETTRYGYPIKPYTKVASGTYGVLSYSVTDEGTVTITKCETSASGIIDVPAMISGLPVTVIGNSAFIGCTSISGVTLPSSLLQIDTLAFSGCSALTTLAIPDSVTTIGDSVFATCTALPVISIGSGLDSFGYLPFLGCSSLTRINISTANRNFTSIDGVMYSKSLSKLIAFPTAKSGAFTFPPTVSEITVGSMVGCKNLTSISLSAAMTSVPASTFSNCTGLTQITFPNTITEIAISAFSGCTSLESVMLPESLTTLGAYAFGGCSALKSAYFMGKKPTSSGYFVFNSVAEGFTIYYLAANKESWAPNNEDNWFGYPIAVFGSANTSKITPKYGSPCSVSGDYLKINADFSPITVADLTGYLEDSSNIRVLNAAGAVLISTDLVGTGCKVQLIKDSAVANELTVMMLGDINGDGKLNSSDIAALQKNILGRTTLTGAYLYAANLNGDVMNDGSPKVDSRDIAQLQKELLK